MEWSREISEKLLAAFPEDELEFLPRAHSNGKALALPYIDARAVMRRLDEVVGPEGWAFDFDLVSGDGKMVRGRLTVLGVTKCDAGEASTEDEILKSAASDALKRAAVHFGIGRYLYYLPRVWAAYDPQKRRFTETPQIDPRAVSRALAVCGLSVRPAEIRGASAGIAAEPIQRPAPPPTLPAVQRAEREERFANPSGPLLTGRSVPPANGAPAAEGKPSLCSECNAPAGKMHRKGCSHAPPEETAGNAYGRGA